MGIYAKIYLEVYIDNQLYIWFKTNTGTIIFYIRESSLMFEFIQYGSDIYRFFNRRCALLEIYELRTSLKNSTSRKICTFTTLQELQ